MSRIVKDGAGAPASGGRVIDGAVYDAKSEAAQIVTEAHAEAEAIRERAREEGRAEGRADVAALLVRARKQVERRIAASEQTICELAIKVAERIVRRQLDLAPELVVDIAKAALEDARGRHDFVLRVHPDDVAAVDADKPGLLARLSVSAKILIRADSTIARGGCVVESDIGTVDARLETQLRAIQRALEDSL